MTQPVSCLFHFVISDQPRQGLPPESMEPYEQCPIFVPPPQKVTAVPMGKAFPQVIKKPLPETSCQACGDKIVGMMRKRGPAAFPVVCDPCGSHFYRFRCKYPDQEEKWDPMTQRRFKNKERETLPSAQRMRISFITHAESEPA